MTIPSIEASFWAETEEEKEAKKRKKKGLSYIEQYRRTGELQGSIPIFNRLEKPQDQEWRIKDKTIYRYNAERGTYTPLMKTFDREERPEDKALRLKGNTIYQYNANRGTYAIHREFPERFISPAPEEEPSPLSTRYWKEVVKNLPGSVERFAGMMVDPQSPTALIAEAHGVPYHPDVTKAETFGKALKETALYAGGIAAAPAILGYHAVTHPFKTLREDPAAFLLGLLSLKHGGRIGKQLIAKQVAKGYMKGMKFKELLEDIPDSEIMKHGKDPAKWKKETAEGIPKKDFFFERRKDAKKRGEIDRIEKKLTKKVLTKKEAEFYTKIKYEDSLTDTWNQRKFKDDIAKIKEQGKEVSIIDIDNFKYINDRFGHAAGDIVLQDVASAFKKHQVKGMEIYRLGGDEFAITGDGAQLRAIMPKVQEFLLDRNKSISWGVADNPVMADKLMYRMKDSHGHGKKFMFDVSKTEWEPLYPEAPPKGLHKVSNFMSKFVHDTPAGRYIMQKIADSTGNKAMNYLVAEDKILNIEKMLTEREMEALPFVREGLADYRVLKKIARQDLEPLIRKPTPKMMQALDMIEDLFSKGWEEAHKFFKADNYVDNYVSHIWKTDRAKSQFKTYFKTHDPYFENRVFPSIEAGIKAGWEPKTTHIGKILRSYETYKYNTMANIQLLESLKRMVDQEGKPLLTDKVEIPGYKRVENSIFRGGEAYVHPEIASTLRLLFEKEKVSVAGVTYDKINAFMKYSNLALTLFHHMALAESALAAGIPPWEVAKVAGQSAWRSFVKTGKKPFIFDHMEMAKDSVKHGGVLRPSPDFQINMLERVLQGIESGVVKAGAGKTAITKAMVGIPRKSFQAWNKMLWDNFHSTLKALYYEHGTLSELKRQGKWIKKKHGREIMPDEVKTIKETVAKFGNDTFGSQQWLMHKLLGNPRWQKWMHRILLAPDWTISVFRQFSSLIRGPMKEALGKELIKLGETEAGRLKLLEGRVLSSQSSRYWKRAIAYGYTTAQLLNLATTQLIDGKARFTWENDPGHDSLLEPHIYMGRGGLFKDIKGEQKIYMRPFKQYTEPMRYVTSPLPQIGGKTAPMARQLIRQYAKHDPGTGWPTAYADEDNFWKSIPARAMDLVVQVMPFSLRQYLVPLLPTEEPEPLGQFMFMYPLSKGMTKTKTIKLFQEALQMKDEGKRTQRMERIAMAAQENGLRWTELYTQAKSAARSKLLFDEQKYLNRYRKELGQLKTTQEKLDALHVYRKREALTAQQARKLATDLEDKQFVTDFEQQEKDRVFLKRIAGDKYLETDVTYREMMDDYTRIRTGMKMHLREKDVKGALDLMKEWNSNLPEKIARIAEIAEKSPWEFARLHKAYIFTPEKFKELYKQAIQEPEEAYKAPFERKYGEQ